MWEVLACICNAYASQQSDVSHQAAEVGPQLAAWQLECKHTRVSPETVLLSTPTVRELVPEPSQPATPVIIPATGKQRQASTTGAVIGSTLDLCVPWHM